MNIEVAQSKTKKKRQSNKHAYAMQSKKVKQEGKITRIKHI
jgi:hypothetical protein